MAAVSRSFNFPGPYPVPAAVRGHSIESLMKAGWISQDFIKGAIQHRRAFESVAFRHFIERGASPICSLEQLKGAIYSQWILHYLQTSELSVDKELFSDELWARTTCPVLVARLFSEEGEPGLNREAYLTYKVGEQISIALRLNQLCQAIAKGHGETQVDALLAAVGLNENADWVLDLLCYATLGHIDQETIVKRLCEAEVIK